MREACILLFCLIVATAHGASIRSESDIPSDLCAQGPQYWCSSSQIAESCGKVQYCEEKEWARDLIVERDRADFCALCEFVMQELEGILEENSTQQQVAAALDQVCTFLPSTLKSECDSFVTQYTPKLIELLVSSYPPSKVCQIIGLCKSTKRVPMKSPTLDVRKVDADFCPLCEFVMQELDGILKENSTQQQITAALDLVCTFLPNTLKDECDSLVQQYTPMLIDLLASYPPSKVCAMIGVCESTQRANRMMAITFDEKKDRADFCALCEFVMQELDGLLEENSTQQQIMTALDQVCTFLPSTLKSQCDSLVTQYTPKLIELLVSSYPPSKVCKIIGLCKSTQRAKILKTPAISVEKDEADFCALCEFVMQELDGILEQNSTQQQIMTALDQVCTFLPSTLKSECDSLVTQYTPKLIELLVSSYPPSKVCQIIGLCKSTHREKITKVAPPAVGNPKADLCPICEFAISQLDGILKENSTQKEIEAALEQVCNFLPGSIKAECDSLIEQFFPTLVQLLLNYKPEDVCKLLGLCTGARHLETFKMAPLSLRRPEADLCPICEFVISQLDDKLKENSTQQEIEAALEQVCNFLPGSIKAECDSLIEQFFPTLVQLLLNYKPEDVCKLLGLCTGARQSETLAKMPLSLRNPKADLCPICELAISQLDDKLKENSTQQEIEKALEEVCEFLPGSLRIECDSLIKQYFPTLVQLILNYKPEDVCKLLGLCTGARQLETFKMAPLSLRNPKADLCPICEFVISQLDGKLKENSTQQESETVLEGVCKFLPASLKTECDSLIKQYFPTLVQLILNYKPEDVCKLLGLCTGARQLRKPEADLCPVCEFAISALDDKLKENSTQQEIEAALDGVCQFLPASLKTECDSLIKQYFPTLVQLILNYKPEDVCKLLGLCTGARQLETVKMEPLSLRKPEADLCPVCEFAISALDDKLKENSTQQEIEAALDGVCQFLPASLKIECDSLIKQYFPTLVQLILNYKPEDVCKLLGLCTNARQLEITKMAPHSVKTPRADLCPICEFAISQLDGILKENSTQQEIEAALDGVCQFLPASLKTECDSLIKQYFPTLVQLILNYKPEDVCKLLGLCTGARQHVDVHTLSRIYKQVTVKKGELCPICIYVFTAVDQMLDSNAAKGQVIAALDKVCDVLPASIKDQCDPFVALYAPYVVDLIVQELSPNLICQTLTLCTNTTTKVKTVEGRQSSTSLKFKSEHKLKPMMPISASKPGAIIKLSPKKRCNLCNRLVRYIAYSNTRRPLDPESVCGVLVSVEQRPQCLSLIRNYARLLDELQMMHKDPFLICQTIKMCPKNRARKPSVLKFKTKY